MRYRSIKNSGECAGNARESINTALTCALTSCGSNSSLSPRVYNDVFNFVVHPVYQAVDVSVVDAIVYKIWDIQRGP